MLHLCLRNDPDGRGCEEDSAGDPETHREPGHRDRPGEVRQHEEKPQIPRGYLWIGIVLKQCSISRYLLFYIQQQLHTRMKGYCL